MLRISKMSDYAILIMGFLLTNRKLFNAREISLVTCIPVDTVSKILKILVKESYVNSVKGKYGGYEFADGIEKKDILSLISIFENDINITDCSNGGTCCKQYKVCMVKNNFKNINSYLLNTLKNITLEDLISKDINNVYLGAIHNG